jgi:hypothetical protein
MEVRKMGKKSMWGSSYNTLSEFNMLGPNSNKKIKKSKREKTNSVENRYAKINQEINLIQKRKKLKEAEVKLAKLKAAQRQKQIEAIKRGYGKAKIGVSKLKSALFKKKSIYD